jgi:hypothetical protein
MFDRTKQYLLRFFLNFGYNSFKNLIWKIRLCVKISFNYISSNVLLVDIITLFKILTNYNDKVAHWRMRKETTSSGEARTWTTSEMRWLSSKMQIEWFSTKRECSKHIYEAFKIIILLITKLLHFSLKIIRLRNRMCFKR